MTTLNTSTNPVRSIRTYRDAFNAVRTLLPAEQRACLCDTGIESETCFLVPSEAEGADAYLVFKDSGSVSKAGDHRELAQQLWADPERQIVSVSS